MFCPQCGMANAVQARFCTHCGQALGAPSGAVPGGVPYTHHLVPDRGADRPAGFWIRALAVLIDTIACQLVTLALVLPLGFAVGWGMADSADFARVEAGVGSLATLMAMALQWLWFTVGESSRWQGSLGKKVLGLRVTDLHGQRIGFGRANARYWSKILSGMLFFIGFLMVAFTAQKQGLHDKIASTLVLR